MKKAGLSITLAIILPLILLISFFLWQLKYTPTLRLELEQKNREYQKAKSTSKRVERLEHQQDYLTQKEQELNNILPVDEKQPLSLIKELIHLGGEVGLKEESFKVRDESSEVQVTGESQAQLKTRYVEMNFEGTFQELTSFLEKLNDTKRLVWVEEIKIERKVNILPYQKNYLKLVTGTF